MSGFTAYHGSPFLFDRFDLAHAYSGEGAQTYGRGVYITDLREGAEKYAKGHFFRVDGRDVMFWSPLLNNCKGTTGNAMLDMMLRRHDGDLEAAASEAALLADAGGDLYNSADQYREAANAAAALRGRLTRETRGYVYSLTVKAARDEFLDVSMPPDQSDSRVAALFSTEFARLKRWHFAYADTPAKQYGAAIRSARKRGTPLEPALLAAGCPGFAIYYPERGATDFVVFDPDSIQVVGVTATHRSACPARSADGL